MKACLDVSYLSTEAVAACVLFHSWSDEQSAREVVEHVRPIAPYQPGQFYRRELPCLLAVLNSIAEPLEAIVIDGYVWLRDEQVPGLGAHLFQALGQSIPVIGVAKTSFRDATAIEVVRGQGHRPLYVTAAGMMVNEAAGYIDHMHGSYRIPTLLKRVDWLCRHA